MRIEFTYARPPEYFAALQRPAAQRAVRQRVVRSALLLLVILLGSALIGGTIGLILAASAVLGTAIGMWILRGKYLALLTVPRAFGTPRHYLITDEQIESSTDATTTRWTWDVVRTVTVTPEALLLRQDGGTFLDIPRAALTSEQEGELIAFVAAQGIGTGPLPPSLPGRRH